jgi:uncharacterized membrane protein
MILVVPLLLLFGALLFAVRAYASASQSASEIEAMRQRIWSLEQKVAQLLDRAGEPAAGRAASPAPAPLVSAPSIPTAPRPEPRPALPPLVIPAPPPVSPRPAPEPVRDQRSSALEAEIGSRWMLIVGVVVLVLGVAFFVKYAFDRRWISETARIAGGTIAGIAVWLLGLRFVRRGYALFGRMIAGGGLAMMFVAAWAAAALYGVVTTEVAFVWLAAVACAAVVTADRQQSMGLAFLGGAFAYAAPFLLVSGTDHHLVLFTYQATLAVATLILARRHGWPVLGLAGWYATWVTFASWMATSYRDAFFVSTELYVIVVSGVFVALLQFYRRRPADGATRVATFVLRSTPAILHLASVYILFDHSLWFLPYLILGTALSVTLASERASYRLIAWAAMAWPFASWIEAHATATWYLPALVTATALYVLHFVPPLLVHHPEEASPPTEEFVLFHCNALGTYLFAVLLLEQHAGSPSMLAASMAVLYLFLAWKFGGDLSSASRHFRPHALAVAFTLVAITISIELTGPWITAAYAAEGAAIIVVGLRMRLRFFRVAGVLLMVVAAMRLVSLQFAVTPAAFTPLANSRTITGAFVVALLYVIAWQYRRGGELLGDETKQAVAVATVAANLLTLGLLTADVSSFWTARPEQLTADFSRQLSVSVTWAVYAMGVIWLGFGRQSATLRYLALTLFGATVLKVFAVDLLALDGIYRITGFIALGLVLLAASFMYQRRRTSSSGATG